ncbi:MAG: tryptophanase [Bacillota bacterium]|jgi:tyrosine phenol-lyase|nr:tryptophanase [Bacillota bacterium]HHT90715.1 tryptophanase [Bacillota bacterium]
MNESKLLSGEQIPLEMHKAKIIQKLNLVPTQRRLDAMREAGFNTFLLNTTDIFLDLLTDSGVNAMSDRQQGAMMTVDDSYAGSQSFTRLEKVCRDLFGMEHLLPAHQGRACEHILSKVLVQTGSVVVTNYHFTTTKAHIMLCGGTVEELPIAEALNPTSSHPFKGNMDLERLEGYIQELGSEKIAFIRMEAGTNLIGGQPFSLENLAGVRKICDKFGVLLVLDASLLADNLYFIKKREEQCQNLSIREITGKICDLVHVLYFSGRKLGCARGGGICTNREDVFLALRELIPLYEGFLTYGGMSLREMEAMAVGLEETMDEEMINQGPEFIAHMVNELDRRGIPVVTPPGGLGCHLNAMEFVDHIPQNQYPAGALAAALYIVSGVRGMERGTLSEQRDEKGNEPLADLELLRLALPRRVYSLSHVKYTIDRLTWLYEHRHMIGGLKFVDEPRTLRFFLGRLEALSDWPEQLARKFSRDLESI